MRKTTIKTMVSRAKIVAITLSYFFNSDLQVIASRVGDDVAFGCENLGVSREETWRRVRCGLELVGLDLPLDHPTAELSGGQKQRLAFAGALAILAFATISSTSNNC